MTLNIEEFYFGSILNHYKKNWNGNPNICFWEKGPVNKLPQNFKVVEFEPNKYRRMWTYATCCMSLPTDSSKLELHIFSSKQDKGLVELLTTIAYYHHNTKQLDLNNTVNFGQPWQNNSECEYGLISLPFLDGPNLENLKMSDSNLNTIVKCYWLIPITIEEVSYKIKFGIESLEKKFEEKGLDYINPDRDTVI